MLSANLNQASLLHGESRLTGTGGTGGPLSSEAVCGVSVRLFERSETAGKWGRGGVAGGLRGVAKKQGNGVGAAKEGVPEENPSAGSRDET